MRVCSLPFLLLFAGITVADDRPTPKYEGKPLDYWVAKLENPADDKERDLATKALEAFSKDAAPAIPKLLVMLEDKSPVYRSRVWDVLRGLKDAAKPAVPALVKRLEEDTCVDSGETLEFLASIGPGAKEAVPVLVKLVAGTDEHASTEAMKALCAIGQDAAKDGFPAILRRVRKDAKGSGFILWYVAKLGPAIVPEMQKLIDDPPEGLEVDRVVRSLGELGVGAKAALPTLKKLILSAEELEEVRKNGIRVGVERPHLTKEEEKKHHELAARQEVGFAAAVAVAKIGPCKEAIESLVVQVELCTLPFRPMEEVRLLGQLGETSALTALKANLARLENWRPNSDVAKEEKAYRDAIKAIEGKKK